MKYTFPHHILCRTVSFLITTRVWGVWVRGVESTIWGCRSSHTPHRLMPSKLTPHRFDSYLNTPFRQVGLVHSIYCGEESV